MVSEVVRANFGSFAAPVLGRAEQSPRQRFAPANDPLLLDHDLVRDADRESRRAWTARILQDTVSIEDMLPRATFAAQLMGQEQPGTRAHVEDFASVIASYSAAERRPSLAATGSTLSIEI